ncbi:MAG: hypothetical protein JNL69_06895 [Bacteroidia bacterium]|nr:hypothetical protein [Bacteroidia bacterium]
MKLLLYSAFFLFIAPCNTSKKLSSSETSSNNDFTSLEIIHKRSICFGKCPAYTLTISGASHTATYVGESNTLKHGKYTKNISDAELEKLLADFDRVNFNAFENEYLGVISDFPTKTTTFSFKGKTKTVVNRHNGPKSLDDLDKILHAISESEGWHQIDAKE